MTINNNTAAMPLNNPAANEFILPMALSNGSNATGSSAQYLIAKAIAETFATDKKAEPDKDKQLEEYEEQAISNAVNASSGGGPGAFQALKAFWLNLANSLPAGSTLQEFAQNQYNLYNNNSTLEALEKQLKADQATYAGSQAEDKKMQNAIDWIQDKINWWKKHWYVPGSGLALSGLYAALESAKGVKWCYDRVHANDANNVKIDESNIAKEEGVIMAKSESGSNLFSSNAGQAIQVADGVSQRNLSSINQCTELAKSVGALNSLQA